MTNMHRFLSILTSLLFAGHVVLGCCGHHASDKCCHAATGSEVGDGCHPGSHCQHDDHDEAPADHEGSPTSGCHLGRCIFCKSPTTQIDLSNAQSVWVHIAVSMQANAVIDGVGAAVDTASNTFDNRLPLHVLHCALLI